jgi:surface protein
MDIETKTGTSWRHQQIFSNNSDTPLANRDMIVESCYYLMVNPIEPIPDNNALLQMVMKWYEDRIDREEYDRYGSIEEWDVSGITDMRELFMGCRNMTADLSEWDVSRVENMSEMFLGCELFKSDLSKWDVSSVYYMCEMFRDCRVFKSDLSKWDVSNVLYMNEMFRDCREFKSDLSKWDVSSVQYMNAMFKGCPLNTGLLKNWNTRSVCDGCLWSRPTETIPGYEYRL